ncbi:hypothetical protein ACU8KH_02936 [Lachancea thermotolerans]
MLFFIFRGENNFISHQKLPTFSIYLLPKSSRVQNPSYNTAIAHDPCSVYKAERRSLLR